MLYQNISYVIFPMIVNVVISTLRQNHKSSGDKITLLPSIRNTHMYCIMLRSSFPSLQSNVNVTPPMPWLSVCLHHHYHLLLVFQCSVMDLLLLLFLFIIHRIPLSLSPLSINIWTNITQLKCLCMDGGCSLNRNLMVLLRFMVFINFKSSNI